MKLTMTNSELPTVTCDGKHFFSPSGRKVAEACPWNGGGGRSEGGREETKNNCVNEI